jgi:hypothetical protein
MPTLDLASSTINNLSLPPPPPTTTMQRRLVTTTNNNNAMLLRHHHPRQPLNTASSQPCNNAMSPAQEVNERRTEGTM